MGDAYEAIAKNAALQLEGFNRWSWQSQITVVRETVNAARHEALVEKLPCGHPASCLIHNSLDARSIWCVWCADRKAVAEAAREAGRQRVYDFMSLTQEKFTAKYGTSVLENAVANLDLSKILGQGATSAKGVR
jgi:hypothetical protein